MLAWSLKAGPALLMGFVVVATIGPALSQESYGYWATSVAPDGVKIGVIYPDYSPNDFAGVSMICIPGTSVVLVTVDSPRALKDGAKAQVEIVADSTRATYSGAAVRSEMDDSTRISFETTGGDPILTAMAAASKLSFSVQHSERELPTLGGKAAFVEFLARCRL